MNHLLRAPLYHPFPLHKQGFILLLSGIVMSLMSACSTECGDVLHFPEVESCNGIDDDCNDIIDNDVTITIWYRDADKDLYGDPSSALESCRERDGYVSEGTDCDDTNSEIHPNATESCNQLDDDCDDTVDNGLDCDADGHSSEDDCNDGDDSVYPGAEEQCNDVDDDCDGMIDDGVTIPIWYRDADKDLYGDPSSALESCRELDGYVSEGTDCDDTNSEIHPNATESCNQLDDDCDNTVDNGFYTLSTREYWDQDCDSFGSDSDTTCVLVGDSSCSNPAKSIVSNRGDCDDSNPLIHPGAEDMPDELDQDCGGSNGPDAYIRAGCVDEDDDNCFITLSAAQAFIDAQMAALDDADVERVLWIFSSPKDETNPIIWTLPARLRRLSIKSILAPFNRNTPIIPQLQSFNGELLPLASCDAELETGALHFIGLQNDGTEGSGQCSNGPYDALLQGSDLGKECSTVILDGLTLHTAVGAQHTTMVLQDTTVEPGEYSTHPSPRVGCGSSLTLQNTLIQNQDGYSDLGAVHVRNSYFHCEDCVVRNNGRPENMVGSISLVGSTFVIRNAAFYDNHARYSAGLSLASSQGSIISSYFSRNTSYPDGVAGVALYVDPESELYLIQSVITGNAMLVSPELASSAAALVEGKLYILNSIIEQNNLKDVELGPSCQNLQKNTVEVLLGPDAVFSCPDKALFLYAQTCDAQDNPIVSAHLLDTSNSEGSKCEFLTDDRLETSFVEVSSLDLHLNRELLKDSGLDCPKSWPDVMCAQTGSDPDGSEPDFGVFGGLHADDFDLDHDGIPAWYWFGTIADVPTNESSEIWDCDDLDPDIGACFVTP